MSEDKYARWYADMQYLKEGENSFSIIFKLKNVSHVWTLFLGQPPDSNGKCYGDTFLNQDGICSISGRYDLGVHHFMTGGISGHKEFFEKLIPSIYAFYLVMPKEHIEDNKMFDRMFANPEYRWLSIFTQRVLQIRNNSFFEKVHQVKEIWELLYW